MSESVCTSEYLAMGVDDLLSGGLVVAGQQVHNDGAAVLNIFVAVGQEELKDLRPVFYLLGERKGSE